MSVLLWIHSFLCVILGTSIYIYTIRSKGLCYATFQHFRSSCPKWCWQRRSVSGDFTYFIEMVGCLNDHRNAASLLYFSSRPFEYYGPEATPKKYKFLHPDFLEYIRERWLYIFTLLIFVIGESVFIILVVLNKANTNFMVLHTNWSNRRQTRWLVDEIREGGERSEEKKEILGGAHEPFFF